ncbi:MAG: DIP1984 family protein [Paludibacteraceae bacterium]|nr:DIP1984 family protein [Paludibacteraceae bacterium]
MKLAEALQERADLNRKIQQLQSRLLNNATVQEGEQTAEDPQALLKELNASVDRLQWIIAKVNLTNCQTKVDGKTLTELIAEKDCLSIKIEKYRNFLNSASNLAGRAAHTEIKVLSAVNVRELQTQLDGLCKQLRVVDNAIQQTNWSTDLIEK